MRVDPNTLAILDVLRRGTTVDIHAESFTCVTSTEVLDSQPDGEGGVVLTLDATIEEGLLHVTEAMISRAELEGACWCIRHGGLVFTFGRAEGVPAFGPDGFFTHNPAALETHGGYVRERDARREARRAEQEGR